MNNYTGYTTTNFDYAMESGIHADNERLTDPAFHDAQRTIDREQARDIMFWLRDGVPTAMNMFQETMRTATLATGDHPPEPTIFIEDDNYLSVQYRPTRAIVSLSSLQIAAQDLLVKCRVQLEEHVLRGYRLPVPFTSTSCNIVDQQASEDPSVDFFTASGNPTADPAYLTALMFHLATQYSDEFISHVAPNSTLVWKLDSLYRWLNQARKLIMMIMVLVHITSGQPARGEELAATTIRCTALGAKRGMYWYRGKIMLVQYYYKRRSRGTADRYIARFLTRELSDILLHYLVLVRPFERVAFSETHSGDSADAGVANYQNFLFVANGNVVTSRDLSRSLYEHLRTYAGVGLGLQAYRQVATFFMRHHLQRGRAFLQSTEEVDNEPDTGDNDGVDDQQQDQARSVTRGIRHVNPEFYDLQAAHSSSVAGMFYARTTNDFRYLSSESIHEFDLCSREWQALLGIDDHIAAPIPSHPQQQPSHQPHQQPPQQQQQSLALAPPLSQLPGMVNSLLAQAAERFVVAIHEKTTKNISPVIEYKPVLPEHVSGLRRFLGNDSAYFRSLEQGLALPLIVERKLDLLVVMPTGMGKSVLFSVPPFLENGKLSVVIVPLVALVKDHERRLVRAGLRTALWQSGAPTMPNAQVLLAPVEAVASAPFVQFCLEHESRISRFVVDECHLGMTWLSFRFAMAKLTVLRAIPVPLLLLTATMPPSMEDRARIFYGCNFATIRAQSTSRVNLSYQIHPLPSNITNNIAFNTLAESLRVVFPNERGIVFCKTVQDAETLFDVLNGGYQDLAPRLYHGQLPETAKDEAQEGWMSDGGIMVATSAFGIGIDAPDVRKVFHWRLPYSLLDYAQQTGRAGRDGQTSVCRVYYVEDREQSTIDRNKQNQEVESSISDAEEMLAFAKSKTCIRFKLQQYLDGRPSLNCLADSEAVECGICHDLSQQSHHESSLSLSVRSANALQTQTRQEVPFDLPAPSHPSMQRRRQQSPPALHPVAAFVQAQEEHDRIQQEKERFLDQCEALKSTCVVCLLHRLPQCNVTPYDDHSQHDYCKRCFHKHGLYGMCLTYKRLMCFKCGLPFNHPLYHGNGEECNAVIKNAVLPACWAIFQSEDTEDQEWLVVAYNAIHRSNQHQRTDPFPATKTAFARWLSDKDDGSHVNNAMKLFDKIVSELIDC